MSIELTAFKAITKGAKLAVGARDKRRDTRVSSEQRGRVETAALAQLKEVDAEKAVLGAIALKKAATETEQISAATAEASHKGRARVAAIVAGALLVGGAGTLVFVDRIVTKVGHGLQKGADDLHRVFTDLAPPEQVTVVNQDVLKSFKFPSNIPLAEANGTAVSTIETQRHLPITGTSIPGTSKTTTATLYPRININLPVEGFIPTAQLGADGQPEFVAKVVVNKINTTVGYSLSSTTETDTDANNQSNTRTINGTDNGVIAWGLFAGRNNNDRLNTATQYAGAVFANNCLPLVESKVFDTSANSNVAKMLHQQLDNAVTLDTAVGTINPAVTPEAIAALKASASWPVVVEFVDGAGESLPAGDAHLNLGFAAPTKASVAKELGVAQRDLVLPPPANSCTATQSFISSNNVGN